MEWEWSQPIGKWKVHTDKIRGTIKVQDEQGRTLLKRENLSEAVVQMIEENFLSIIATQHKKTQ